MTDVNVKDKYGVTPLMYAVKNAVDERSEEVVSELLESGANLEEKCKYGNTALIYAVDEYSSTTTRTVKTLLDAGADVNARNNRGETALYSCISVASKSKLQYAKMKILLDAGADVNEKSAGATILMRTVIHAKIEGREDAVRLLLEYGADVNSTNSLENDALKISLLRSSSLVSKAVTKNLLDGGVDVTRKNIFGNTVFRAAFCALYFGKEFEMTEIITMFVENIF